MKWFGAVLAWAVLVACNATETGTLHPRVAVLMQGVELHIGTEVALTTQVASYGQVCNASNVVATGAVDAVRDLQTIKIADVAVDAPIAIADDIRRHLHVCVRTDDTAAEWIHQGNRVQVQTSSFPSFQHQSEAMVLAIQGEGPRVYLTPNGATVVAAGEATTLRLFGVGFSRCESVAFTTVQESQGSSCQDLPVVAVHRIIQQGLVHSDHMIQIDIRLPEMLSGVERYYLCVKESGSRSLVHQGDAPWLTVQSRGRHIPLWLQCVLVSALLVLSGLFSGLNLGLMSLDTTELQVVQHCGTPTEKKYARTILPLRRRGNYLLCSLLLGNVLVNSTLTILLDDLTSGLVAVVGATVGIVVFGEIIPQAICSRHGLAIGAKTILATKLVMVLTLPLSYPISKILDATLGQEMGRVYDREKLMEYIRLTQAHSQLETEEINIISGVLELKKKSTGEVMTRLSDVFMLPYNAILDYDTLLEIVRRGYTRIPVYDGRRDQIVSLLNIKDLAFVDADDLIPLKTVCEHRRRKVVFVDAETTLDSLLREFKTGRSRMMFVREVVGAPKEPTDTVVGVVTLEDVIEFIIQSKINNTEDICNSRRRSALWQGEHGADLAAFGKLGYVTPKISPQLAVVTYQFLSTSVAPFKEEFIQKSVLQRLLMQDVFVSVKKADDQTTTPKTIIFQAGRPADYFVLLLQGHAQVTVGQENFVFDAGPFVYFGLPAVSADQPAASSTSGSQGRRTRKLSEGSMGQRVTFVPEYTVEAVTDLTYLKVTTAVYQAAYRASRQSKGFVPSGGSFKRKASSLVFRSTRSRNFSIFGSVFRSSATSLCTAPSSVEVDAPAARCGPSATTETALDLLECADGPGQLEPVLENGRKHGADGNLATVPVELPDSANVTFQLEDEGETENLLCRKDTKSSC